ncbi:MAG TPA: RluA family pseudouridine synthase [Xanthobacteraceae bacterium]|jgi:tRNA pseudouridine32 synthase/23S rRNA pseudouridine746 synthase|nr:RluA family pseudouridine synthase [Xanthobacteraceae bacterium]
MTPEEIERRVLYRDALMLVIDKPAGFAVHRGPKGGESLEDYFEFLRFGLPRTPALAHRLDRDTAGCLVLGRHRKALAHLGLLFKHGRIGKTYWAVVEGGPEADEGRIDLPLGRLDPSRGWWMRPDPQGQPAVTTWRVLGRTTAHDVGVTSSFEENVAPPPQPSPASGEGARLFSSERSLSSQERQLTWLALEPLTGRTHQLRVHCSAMGWPILGDAIYGSAPQFGGPGLHLQAREIVVPLYPKRDPIRVTAPLPAAMIERFAACGFRD